MSEEQRPWCRSCLTDIVDPDKNGVCVDGHEYEICKKCWEEMSPFERITIMKTYGEYEDDLRGMGTAEAMTRISTVLTKAFEFYHGHVWYDSCKDCKRFSSPS